MARANKKDTPVTEAKAAEPKTSEGGEGKLPEIPADGEGTPLPDEPDGMAAAVHWRNVAAEKDNLAQQADKRAVEAEARAEAAQKRAEQAEQDARAAEEAAKKSDALARAAAPASEGVSFYAYGEALVAAIIADSNKLDAQDHVRFLHLNEQALKRFGK